MHPRRRGAVGRVAGKKARPARRSSARAAHVHPREVDEHFAHGTVTNYWGGSSNATTHLLDVMHYRGLLRVVRRDAGIRLYAAHEHARRPAGHAGRRAALDAARRRRRASTRRCPAPSLSAWWAGCATPCRSGDAS